jgi:hypothetical protein
LGYLLILGLALAALYAWGIGSNDIANIIATPIGGLFPLLRLVRVVWGLSGLWWGL